MLGKKTIRVKLSLMLIGMLILVVAFGLIFANVFLAKYYVRSKTKSLEKAFNSVNEIYVDGLEAGSDSSTTYGYYYHYGTSQYGDNTNSSAASATSASSSSASLSAADGASQASSSAASASSQASSSAASASSQASSSAASASSQASSPSAGSSSEAGAAGASDAEGGGDEAPQFVVPETEEGSTSQDSDNNTDGSSNMVVSEELQLKMDKISDTRSISILVYRTFTEFFILTGQLHSGNQLLYSSLGVGRNSQLSNDKIYSDYIYSKSSSEELEPGEYRISRVSVERLDSGYLYLEGKLENGDSILMRAPLASIEESVGLSNQFFFYILIFSAIIGFIIAYFVTGRFVKPIAELTTIAKRMSELDFTAKYNVRSEDEIGDLGNSINTLSESLEKAITELKDANAELQQDLKKKEEIDELRKEFLSNVSHELKTPIALIQGYAEGLQDNITEDEESRQFYCDVIVDEAKKMNNMVKQIMSLNQLEFGYSHVNFEYFDVTQLIQSVIQRSDILIREKEAKIEFDCQKEEFVWSDAFMTEEVFTNYFTNALNHLDGEKIIRITMERSSEKTLRISVFNTGEPIPEESLDRIWDKFYKVDKARTREYGGSGVGLSIVKATMNLLGQEFGVENKEDGVCFWFELDCSDTKKEEDTVDGEDVTG